MGDGARIYHPGGLDYDGRSLWTAVAEYRPNKPSIIYRVDPLSLRAREPLRTPDHIALVDVVTMRPLNEVPFQQYTDQRQVATRNAIDVQVVNGRLRLYLVADDDESDLVVYEAG